MSEVLGDAKEGEKPENPTEGRTAKSRQSEPISKRKEQAAPGISEPPSVRLTVMVYVMTDRYKEPALPSVYYYGGIETGYRQNGLPVPALAKAWDNCVKEVHARTKEINAQVVDTTKYPKRRNHHER